VTCWPGGKLQVVGNRTIRMPSLREVEDEDERKHQTDEEPRPGDQVQKERETQLVEDTERPGKCKRSTYGVSADD